MDGRWTEQVTETPQAGTRAVDELLRTRLAPGQKHAEQESVRPSYLALDVRLKSGEYRGFWYYDIDGPLVLDAAHTTLTVPFRSATLTIRGRRLLDLYRALLHHSLDILEAIPHAEFDDTTTGPVVQAIKVEERG